MSKKFICAFNCLLRSINEQVAMFMLATCMHACYLFYFHLHLDNLQAVEQEKAVQSRMRNKKKGRYKHAGVHITSFMNMGTQRKFKCELAKRLCANLTFFQLWPVYLEIYLSSGTFVNTVKLCTHNRKILFYFLPLFGHLFQQHVPAFEFFNLLKWYNWSSNTTINQIYFF